MGVSNSKWLQIDARRASQSEGARERERDLAREGERERERERERGREREKEEKEEEQDGNRRDIIREPGSGDAILPCSTASLRVGVYVCASTLAVPVLGY